jgi:uncharacterized protein YjbJ (UPF0337 family)
LSSAERDSREPATGLGLLNSIDHRSTELDMSENRIAGAAKKAGGAIEEATGKAVGNPTMEAKGAANKAAGTVQNKVGKAQDAVGAAIRK